VLSHLLGFEMMVQGSPVAALRWPWPDYVAIPLRDQRGLRGRAPRRAGIGGADQFRELATRALATLRVLSDDAWDKVGWSPEGERPYIAFRRLGCWTVGSTSKTFVTHCWSLGRPRRRRRDCDQSIRGRVALLLGKKVKAPEATLIQVNLSGRLARTIVFERARRTGRGAVGEWRVPTVEITTPVAIFWRRMAGRISADAFLTASASDVRG